MKKRNVKILAFGLASLLALSNVIPVVAAYGASSEIVRQESVKFNTAITRRNILKGSAGSTAELPKEEEDDSAGKDDTAPEKPTPSEKPAPSETPAASSGELGDSSDDSGGAADEEETEAVNAELMTNRAGAIRITKEDDLDNLFPDDNLRNIVFAAVKDGKDNASGVSIEDALENFTGSIKASGKGIREADGIQYLKCAEVIDLRKNKITDFTMLAKDKKYYGIAPDNTSVDINDREEIGNVYWKFGGNPFKKLPKNFGGRLVIEQAANTHSEYDDPADVFTFVRGSEESFLIKPVVEKCMIENRPVRIISIEFHEKTGVIGHPGTLVWEKSPEIDSGFVANAAPQITGVKKSAIINLAIGIDEELHYDTEDVFGTSTPGSQSFKYYTTSECRIYDKISLEVGGAVVLSKKDDDNKSIPLANAKFILRHAAGSKVNDNIYITDSKGSITIADLAPGPYYFEEIEAPAGYELESDPEKRKFSFEIPPTSFGVALGGGVKSVTPDGGSEVRAKANETFIMGTAQSAMSSETISCPPITLTGPSRNMTVTVTYSKVENKNAAGSILTDEKRTFSSLNAAADDVNAEKNANRILGPVKIKVDYKSIPDNGAGTVSLSVTNSKSTVDIVGEKIWYDDPDYHGNHPEIAVRLLQDGQEIGRKEFAEGPQDGDYSYEFKNLPKRAPDGHKYVYSLKEEFSTDYAKDFFVSYEGYNIINAHKGAKRDVSGKKFWDDNGYTVEHPDVTIDLYRNNIKFKSYVIPSGESNYHFADLEVADVQGNMYTYTVKERPVAGYTYTLTGDRNFLNTYNPPDAPPSDPPETPPSNPPTGGGGGGGGGHVPPRSNVPPEPYGPGTVPPEGVPSVPGNPPETPQIQSQGGGEASTPLPKTGEEPTPFNSLIFLSGALAIGLYVTGRGWSWIKSRGER